MRATADGEAGGRHRGEPPPYIEAADASKIVVVHGGGLPPELGFAPVRDRPGVVACPVADAAERRRS